MPANLSLEKVKKVKVKYFSLESYFHRFPRRLVLRLLYNFVESIFQNKLYQWSTYHRHCQSLHLHLQYYPANPSALIQTFHKYYKASRNQ